MKVAQEVPSSGPTNYLNTIYIGEGAYGVEAAAETYYDETVPSSIWPRRP